MDTSPGGAQVIGHSVGAWCAFEFLMLAREQGLPMPRVAFLSAMASPDLAAEARPWRRQCDLSEEAFKVGGAEPSPPPRPSS